MTSYYQEALRISKKPYFLKRNFLAEKEFSFKYIRYRILRPLLKIYTKSYRLLIKNSPWLAPPSIKFLQKTLNNNLTFLEFGSGKSTLFFAGKVKHLVSVEHHEGWYNKVKDALNTHGFNNVSYKLIRPEKDELKIEIDKRHREEFDVELINYKDYYGHLDNYPEAHFDFILIDGRARVECVQHSIPKLKPGGVLMVDNSERKRYKPIFNILSEWKMINTTNGLTDTTLWFKP